MDFHQTFICALILWRSGLGLLMGKFCQFVTELSAYDMIMVGYYCFTFLFYLFIFFFVEKYEKYLYGQPSYLLHNRDN